MTNSSQSRSNRTQIVLWWLLILPFLVLGGAGYAYVFLAKSYAWALLGALLPAIAAFSVSRLLGISVDRFARWAGAIATGVVLAVGYAGAWHINQTNVAVRLAAGLPLASPSTIDAPNTRGIAMNEYFGSPDAAGHFWDHIKAMADRGPLVGTMPAGWPPLPLPSHRNRAGAAAWAVWCFQACIYGLLFFTAMRAAALLNSSPSTASHPSSRTLSHLETIFKEHGVTHALTPAIAPLRPWPLVHDFFAGWHSFWKVIAAMGAFAILYHAWWEAFVLWLLFSGALFRASFFVFHPREEATLGSPLDRLLNQLAQQVRVGVMLLVTLGTLLWVYRNVDINATLYQPDAGRLVFLAMAILIPYLLARLWPAFVLPLVYRGQGIADLWSHPTDARDTHHVSALIKMTVTLAWQLTATPGAFFRATLPVALSTASLFTLMVQLEPVFNRLTGMTTFASLFLTVFALPFLHFLILERALALRNACPQATASAIRATGTYFANDPYPPSVADHPLSWIATIVLPLHLWPARWRRSENALRHAHSRAHHDLARGARKRAGRDPTRLLHHAARIGNRRLVEEALVRGAQIDGFDDQGYSALINALVTRRLSVALLLLDRGADPNLAERGGRPPLFFALESHDPTIVAQLLRYGANPGQRDKASNTCWHIAAQAGKTNLCELLISITQDINAANQSGYRPAHLAGHNHDDVATLEWLAAHGANLTVPAPPDNTSLASLAARRNRPGMLRVLFELDLPIDDIDGTRRTPLIHAVMHESSAAIAMLLHLGADPHKPTFSGTALEIAEQQLADRHTALRETILDMLRDHVVAI